MPRNTPVTDQHTAEKFRDLARDILGEDHPVTRFEYNPAWGENWSGHWADFIADCIYRQEGEFSGGMATVIAELVKKAEQEG